MTLGNGGKGTDKVRSGCAGTSGDLKYGGLDIVPVC